MVIWDAFLLLSQELGDKREAELLLGDILKTDISGIILNKNNDLKISEEEKLSEYIKRRKSGEPVQYIMGYCEFMSLEFLVNPSVLIPRSDTETLVEYLIAEIGDKKIKFLDIGTGSGCIAISILKNCPNATAVLLDISDGALDVAIENAKKNNVIDRAEFLNMDILKEYPERTFDLVVSNPPYIRPDVIEELEKQVKDFEPYTALCGGEDGLVFYRRITDIANKILREDGILAYEIGYDQGVAVSEILDEEFSDVKIIKDLCENDRVVTGKRKCH